MKELFENMQGFIQTNIDLAKLEIQEKIEYATKTAAKYLIIIFLGFFAILFILLSLGYFLGNILGNNFYGFGIIALILILISTIIYFTTFKKPNTD
jgi:pilus assembly protein TadC